MITKNEDKLIGRLGYSGQINVLVKSGENIMFSQTYHNQGNRALFRFLCSCIAGDYVDAEYYRPVKIKLYHHNTDESPAQARLNLSQGNLTRSTAISGKISTDTIAKVEETDTGYQVTLHFLVPWAYISSTTENKINQVILYPAKKTVAEQDSMSAYYLFTENKIVDGVATESWSGINPSDFGEHTNLIIEWTMSIVNI